MTNRKRIFVTLSLAVLVLLVLNVAFENKAKAAATKAISWATMPMGSSSYAVTAAQANVSQKYTGIRINVEGTRGVRDWGPLMGKREIQFANLSVASVTIALEGRGAYSGNPYKFIRLVSNGHQSFQSVYAKKGSGINRIRDLKGKVFYGGTTGHDWSIPLGVAILEGHGLKKSDVKFLGIHSPQEALRDVIEGRADSYTYTLNAMFIELRARVGGYAIPLEESSIEYIEKAVPGLVGGTAPKGYLGLDSDLPCVMWHNSLWTSIDVSDEVVYEVVKALYEHHDEYKATNTNTQQWTLKTALNKPKAPFHPGAIKYYKEKGVWTPELAETQSKLLKRLGELWGTPVSK